jgi:hypothetical protein
VPIKASAAVGSYMIREPSEPLCEGPNSHSEYRERLEAVQAPQLKGIDVAMKLLHLNRYVDAQVFR